MGEFPHRRLEVYALALRVGRDVYFATRSIPAAAWPIGRQVVRAVSSIVLNIAEGAGEYRPAEKARFYRMARRSAAETASAIDLLIAIDALNANDMKPTSELLDQIGAMLTKMARTHEARVADRHTAGGLSHGRAPKRRLP